jgi:putative endonuclease
MFYVCLLRAINFPDQVYIGMTIDLKRRLKAHNEGSSPYTSRYQPWELVVYVGVKNEARTLGFEKYLKTGAGRAFAKKHLW